MSADDDSSDRPSRWQDIGCIELAIRRFHQQSRRPGKMIDHSGKLNSQPIHERSKKAGAHRIAYASLFYTDGLSTYLSSCYYIASTAGQVRIQLSSPHV